MQWGQEGKKKLLHVLAPDYDFSCRFNGGKSSEPSILPNGSPLWLIPEGLVHETGIKCILGNGVSINPHLLLEDLSNLDSNGIDYADRLLISQRSHLVTAFHRKVADRLKEIRKESGVWLAPTGVANAFKPLKMGIRVSNLQEPWREFLETYDRVLTTCDLLFKVKLSKEEREMDLDAFQKVREIIKRN